MLVLQKSLAWIPTPEITLVIEAVIANTQFCYLLAACQVLSPHALRSRYVSIRSQQWLGAMKHEKIRGHRYYDIISVLILYWWAQLCIGNGQRLLVSSALQGVFDPIVLPNGALRAPGVGPLECQDGPVLSYSKSLFLSRQSQSVACLT